MKLVKAQDIMPEVSHQVRELRRGDLVDPFTFGLPPGVEDGPLDEILLVQHYDGTEKITLTRAIITGFDCGSKIEIEGNLYIVTYIKGLTPRDGYAFAEEIECIRNV